MPVCLLFEDPLVFHFQFLYDGNIPRRPRFYDINAYSSQGLCKI